LICSVPVWLTQVDQHIPGTATGNLRVFYFLNY